MKKLYSLTFVLALLVLPSAAFAACNSNPSDTTNAATSITVSAGTVNGNVTSAGGGTCSVTARGFATSTNATLSSSVATSTLAGTTGSYSALWDFNALSANSTYYFRAYATNSHGTGFGSILSFITLPNAPTALTYTSVADTTMTVSWTAPSPGGASTYTLERCINGTTTCTQTTSIAGVSQNVTSLTGNTNYDFAVQGVNANAGAGAFTATSSQLTLPSAPTMSAYTGVTNTTITANWSAPTGGAATYKLERCITSTTTCVLTTAIAATTQAVSGLSQNTSYDFAVLGTNNTGDSTWSATTTQATTNISTAVAPLSISHGSLAVSRGALIIIH